MPTYEVFLKPSGRDGFTHAGSFDAPDDVLAEVMARETYIRRGEGEQAWVIQRAHVISVDSSDLAVTTRRTHAINDGSAVAASRKERRLARASESQTPESQTPESQTPGIQTPGIQTPGNQTLDPHALESRAAGADNG
jgi:phenylacetate-CoA oxygenase PaaH subunit